MKYDKELDWLVPEPLDFKHWEHHAKGQIIEQYRDYFTGTVADFGCNNGVALCMLSNLNVDYAVGFDISAKAIADGESVIQRHIKARPDKIIFRCCNLLEIDSDDDRFDAGLCLHTLEHIYPEDLHQVVSEIHRVLKPGAAFVFSMPCRDAFKNAKSHVAQFSIDPEDGYVSLRELFAPFFDIEEVFEDTRLDANQQRCITGLALNKEGGICTE